MKLKLSDLVCHKLELLSDDDPTTSLLFEEIANGTGDLEFRDGLTLLNAIAVRQVLASLELPLGDGRLFTERPATVSHVTCEGRIRNGFAGKLQASILESECLCLETESVKVKGHLVAEGLVLKLDGRGGRVQVSTLTLNDAQCTVGTLLIRLGTLVVSGLKLEWDEGRPRLEASRATARDLVLQQGEASVTLSAIDLAEGVNVHDLVQVPQIFIGALEIAVADLRREAQHEPAEERPVSDAVARIGLPPIELDHGVFETVNGQLDVDATLSVTLPVIGKRVATHHFRIPVDGGIIDYRDFEKGLADLEDAFIDIRVRGNTLVLERDIPLIPGLEKPLLRWQLTTGERELATNSLVRLETLLKAELAFKREEDEEKAKKSKVKLHRLDFDNLALNFSLDETAVLKSGEGFLRAHIDELELAGSLHYDPDPDDEVEETRLGAKGTGLGTVAQDLTVFGHRLSASLTVGTVESFLLTFHELSPTSLATALKQITISGVEYDLRPV